MNAKVRRSVRVAVIVGVLLPFIGPGGPGGHTVVRGFQAAPAPDLDRALRAGDLDKARQLMPVSWAASEQLFASYLERAFVSADAARTGPEARSLATRWAEVHFRIVEYDFARAVLLALDTADSRGRAALATATR